MSDFETLWACFLSGQMEESDLIERMHEDAEFSAFVAQKEANK